MVLASDPVLKPERRRLEGGTSAWLNHKYPSWEDSWGVLWDQIIKNVNEGDLAQTLPKTLPALCNLTQLPIGRTRYPPPSPGVRHQRISRTRLLLRFRGLENRRFELEPERYAGHLNLVDRFIAGMIEPADLAGVLQWMGLTSDVMGDDGANYGWAPGYFIALKRRGDR